MTAFFLTGGLAALSLSGMVVRRLRPYGGRISEAKTPRSFSLARYKPMERLLAEEDFLFLSSQPGYRPEIGAKFQRERRRLFRLYLAELANDFHRLHATARALAVDLPEEHAGLIGALIRQKLTFWRAMATVEIRLTLHQLGVGAIDVRSLVDAMAGMHAELSRFTAPAPVAI